MIQLYNLSKFYGRKAALSDLTLDVAPGEFAYIAGPSGAGKTTLIKLIMGEEQASQGQLLVDKMNLKRLKKDLVPKLRNKLGVVFQDFKLIPNWTIYQNIALKLEIMGVSRNLIGKKVRLVLKKVGLEDLALALPAQLSGGEQQRVAIARAIVGDPKILLADEPTGNLDMELGYDILKLILSINETGTTVLMASHNRELMQKTGHRIIHLVQGRLAE
jgi:cell division transport system ATP-binding protein